MINALLDNIQTLLKTELAGLVTTNRFVQAPLSTITNLSLPIIALYPHKLTLTPDTQQTLNTNQTYREFQQAFCIEMASTEAGEAEELMSLVLGILTLSQAQLLQSFQQSPEKDDTFTYTSAQFGTLHRLRQLHFLSAQPVHTANRHQWHIQGMATGHLYMGRLEPQSQEPLTQVTIKSHLPQIEVPDVSQVTHP